MVALANYWLEFIGSSISLPPHTDNRTFLSVVTVKLLNLLTQCCCRYHGLKKKNPNELFYKEWKTQQVFPLQEGSKLQMQEQARQQLVRKVSRVNFQSRSNVSHQITYNNNYHILFLLDALLFSSTVGG